MMIYFEYQRHVPVLNYRLSKQFIIAVETKYPNLSKYCFKFITCFINNLYNQNNFIITELCIRRNLYIELQLEFHTFYPSIIK